MGDQRVVTKWMSFWEDIVRDKMLDLLCVVTGKIIVPLQLVLVNKGD
jgi:hypothetical protein